MHTTLNRKTLTLLNTYGRTKRASAEAKAERDATLAALKAELPRATATPSWLVAVAVQWVAPSYKVTVAGTLSREGRPVFEGEDTTAARKCFADLIADMRRAGITVKGRAPREPSDTDAKSADPMQVDADKLRAKYPTAALRRRLAALILA